jgi:putative transposase
MAKHWLTIEQLQHFSGWSKRTIQQKCADKVVCWRHCRERDRNGRQKKEYDLFSLPAELQLKYGQQLRSDEAAIVQVEKKSGVLLPFVVKPAAPSELRMPSTEAHNEQVDFRVTVISPLLELLKVKGKAERREWCKANGFLVGSADALAKQIAENHGVGRATLWRWVKIFRDKGANDLFNKARGDKGVSRWFARYPEAGALVAYVYLLQRQSIMCAWEAVKRDAVSLGIPQHDLPSYETVRAATQSIPKAWKSLAREGTKKYREMCAPYLTRGYEEPANAIWVSDHAIFDVEVMNNYFPEHPFGTPIRLRLTAILDFRSRYMVGYSFSWEGSSRSIGTALRHAILTHGPCDSFYCDNGKDYLKVAKGAKPAYLQESVFAPEDWHQQEMVGLDKLGLLARCGINVRHCLVRHPQSKHVERFFRTMHEQFDKKWWTYTGGTPSRRPDLTEVAMADHRKLMRHGEVESSLHPRASIFMQAFANWLNEYHNKEHGGKGMNKRTPLEVFAQERDQNSRRSINEDTLIPMLLSREARIVQECAVRLGNKRYVHYDGDSLQIMHRLNREQVIVAYDENDPDAVAILDQDGNFLTWLRIETLLPQSSAAGPAIAASMRDRRHLEKQTRNILRSVALEARATGAKSEVERFIQDEQWQLPMAVNDNVTHSKPRNRPDLKAVAPETASEIAAGILEALR